MTAAPARLFPALLLLVTLLFLASLLIGPAALGLGESLKALVQGEGGAVVLVMREIRLPRAVLALLVGGALGLSGAAMQGFLRNPLAEPGLIGVSSMAALGAVLALQTGLAALFPLALPGAALVGAGLSVLIILLLAGPRGGGPAGRSGRTAAVNAAPGSSSPPRAGRARARRASRGRTGRSPGRTPASS